jgi:hypothetical protein
MNPIRDAVQDCIKTLILPPLGASHILSSCVDVVLTAWSQQQHQHNMGTKSQPAQTYWVRSLGVGPCSLDLRQALR